MIIPFHFNLLLRKLNAFKLLYLNSLNLTLFKSPPKPHTFVTLPLQSGTSYNILFSYLFKKYLTKYICSLAIYIVTEVNILKSKLVYKALLYYSNLHLTREENKLLSSLYALIIELVILEDEIIEINAKYKNNMYFILISSLYSLIFTIFFYESYSSLMVLIITIIVFASILFYIRFGDKRFISKYPTLYNILNIICIISLLILIYYLLIHLYKVFINPNSQSSSSLPPSAGNDGGSGGPGGPNNPQDTDVPGDKAKSKEDKDKERKEKSRLYRLNNKEKIKSNRKKYNDSAKGKEVSKKYVSDNIDQVNATKKKYRDSDLGKETLAGWVDTHSDNIKANSDKYRHSDKGRLTMKQYYEENKDYLNIIRKEGEDKEKIRERSALYYDQNKEKIKARVKEYRDAHTNEISLTKALKYALTKMERDAEKRAIIDQKFLVQMMNSMAAAQKTKDRLDGNDFDL